MKAFTIYAWVLICISEICLGQNDSVEKRKWFVPDFIVSQYAGSIGLISVGTGYDVFKNKGKLDILAGFVPGFVGSAPLESITLKLTMQVFKTNLHPYLTIYPLTAGMFFCYTPGREFSSNLPAWYPEGYYWWSEAIRVNLFIGGSAKFTSARWTYGKWVSMYYEIGTNEIKLVSYVQNGSTLSLWTILHAGIGVRYHFIK